MDRIEVIPEDGRLLTRFARATLTIMLHALLTGTVLLEQADQFIMPKVGRLT